MSSLIGLLLAMLGTLLVLPTSLQKEQQAALTTTIITTAQQQQQLLSAAQAWITQNLTTVQATATAATPMVIPVSTLTAANVGLPSTFSAINPFGQTWQVQALQPTAGTLQVLVVATGGQSMTDLQAAAVAQNVGQPGGFIPQNDSGVYPLGAAQAYGNQANWDIPTAGYSGVSGGHPAALLVVANGQVQNNALYRVSVPGQPQLNQMQTAIDMNSNNINNAATVNAQKVVTAAGNSVQVGSTYLYGDTANTALRQNGALYIQNQSGTAAADIAQVGNVTASGTVNVSGNVNAAGGMWTGGTVSATNVSTSLDVNASRNVNAAGYVWANNAVMTNGNMTANDYWIGDIGKWASQIQTVHGGAFYYRYTDGACLGPNPVTGGCSCPSGTSAYTVITAVGTYMGALTGLTCN